MVRTGFFWRALLGLLLIGLLAAGGAALFRAGWFEGFQAASIAAASGAESSPPAPFYYPYWGYGPRFSPFGFVGLLGMIFLFFILFGGLFRMWGWRHYAMHAKWEHGEAPPWVKEWKERHTQRSEGTAPPQAEAPGSDPASP